MVYQLENALINNRPLEWEPDSYRVDYRGSPWGGTVLYDGKLRTIRIASSRYKFMPDFQTPGLWLISEAAKNVFEGLEPGVHRYYPVDVFLKNGTPVPTKHFVWDICRRIDAIRLEESDLVWVDVSGMPSVTISAISTRRSGALS